MEKAERNLTLNEKELKQALESKDKNVVIDFALQYKWERDQFERMRADMIDYNRKLEKELDILASIFVRETTFGQDDKEEMRNKKKHILALVNEVADYMINGSFENQNETEI